MKILLISLLMVLLCPQSHAKKRYFRAIQWDQPGQPHQLMDEYDGPAIPGQPLGGGRMIGNGLPRWIGDWRKEKVVSTYGARRYPILECIMDDRDLPSEFQSAEYKIEYAEACAVKIRQDTEIAAALLKRNQQMDEIKRIADETLEKTIEIMEASHQEEMEILRGIIRGLCAKLGVPVPAGI